MSDVLELTCELIERPSVTPDDAGCQEVIAERLENLGFTIESMPFGDVTNLWARLGNVAPVVAFAGHTDVVPPGAIDDWRSDPFQPDIRDGRLYGRGAADMKASLAAMVVACERFLTSRGRGSLGPLPGSIAFLLTSDEEGPAVDGTRRVVERLGERGEQIDHCIVGEPSSAERLGDTVKIGRRGSLNGHLTVRGVQGHVAYPERADNPIHRLAGALAALTSEQWDRGNGHFPPTSLQVSNINAGTGADNVIPGVLDMAFNLRFSTESRVEDLKARVQGILDRHGLSYDLRWRLSGVPFLTEPGALVSAAEQSIVDATGVTPQLATSGGTSDGRFIAPTGAQVVEFGPVNRSIHQIDEHVAVADLEPLAAVYQGLLGRLLAGR